MGLALHVEVQFFFKNAKSKLLLAYLEGELKVMLGTKGRWKAVAVSDKASVTWILVVFQ